MTPLATLVVPAYNEEARLREGLDRLLCAADVDLERLEVLVVDDGSSDQTVLAAQRELKKFPLGRVASRGTNEGKGAAVRTGLFLARGGKVLFADADMSIDPDQIPRLLEALDESQIAIGARTIGGRIDYSTLSRTLGGRAFNLMVRATCGIPFEDTQCGFKGFRRGEALLLAHLMTVTSFAFDVELLWIARQLRLSIREVPVSWTDFEGSSVSVRSHSSQMMRDILTMRLRRRVISAVTLSNGEPVPAIPGGMVLEGGSSRLLVASVSGLLQMDHGEALVARTRDFTLQHLRVMAPLTVRMTS